MKPYPHRKLPGKGNLLFDLSRQEGYLYVYGFDFLDASSLFLSNKPQFNSPICRIGFKPNPIPIFEETFLDHDCRLHLGFNRSLSVFRRPQVLNHHGTHGNYTYGK
ncbi:hypothetical protein L1887_03087 [Cichorium endivia]|nr:hypothetical protein L1887_03087 [Cichorium endivia]